MLLPAWLDGRWIVREAHPCLCCFQWAMCNQRLVGCLTFQCKRLSTCRFAFWFLCSLSFLIDSMGQAWDTTYKYITKSKKRRKKKNVSTVYEWRWVFMLGFGSRPHLIYMNVCIVSWCCVVLGNINMIAWKLGNGQCVASATHTHTHTQSLKSKLSSTFIRIVFIRFFWEYL